jgi:hypothetical protein
MRNIWLGAFSVHSTKMIVASTSALLVATASYGLASKPALDSVEIAKADVAKISFKDLGFLSVLSRSNKVLFHGHVMSEREALGHLKAGPEDSFCSLKGADSLHPNDYVKLVDGHSEVLDASLDFYRTQLVYQNSNGSMTFTCTHTTKHFYMEDMRSNFEKYLRLTDFDGSAENERGYINPQTDNRRLGAIQISNMEVFKKITLNESAQEGFSLLNGKAISVETALNHVEAAKEQMTCMIVEPKGQIDTQKIFFKVSSGISDQTSSDIPTAGVYTVYRADSKTSFIINCRQHKSAKLAEFFKAGHGVFKFGMLERLDYLKKSREMKQLHTELSRRR